SQALRHDGSPPFYYLVLHGWMAIFGDGDVAVRAFSGLVAVAALPLAWLVGRRLGGRPAAWGALLLLASSPFAIRYATETRMYSLVILLVLGGYLALDAVLDRRSSVASVVLGGATGALLLTHYWSFFLVLTVAGSLLVSALRARRRGDTDASSSGRRAGALRAVLAMAAGSLLFVPWIPDFLYQAANTGTPWGRLPPPRVPFDVVFQFAAGLPDLSLPLGLLVYALVVLGIFGLPAVGGVVGLDLRGRSPGRTLAVVAVVTLTVGVAVGRISGAAFAVRYAAVVFPLVVLIAGLGYAVLAPSRAGPWALGLAVVLGFATSIPFAAGDRTSAAVVAEVLRDRARPGDVVAYCPDQLGPGVSRLLDRDPGAADPGAGELVQLTFPRGTPPEFVDWIGYEEAVKAARPADFARMLLDRAGPDHDVWVVWAPSYRTFGVKCQLMMDELRRARGSDLRLVKVSSKNFERPGLALYPHG
ncbi:MAG: mannosyltransferase, partial [Actinomycetota bacterium]|nr:mannosyltransferase [Actinomycetota bacterium]